MGDFRKICLKFLDVSACGELIVQRNRSDCSPRPDVTGQLELLGDADAAEKRRGKLRGSFMATSSADSFAAFGCPVFGVFVPDVAVIRGSFRGIRGIRGPQQIQVRDPRRDFEPRSNPFLGTPS